MIDKNEQRRRAEELSRNLAAQGQVAPKLTWPTPVVPTPKPAQPVVKKSTGIIKYDCAGQLLNIGDKVATTVDGLLSQLVVGTITGFAPKKVYIDVPVKPGTREARHGLTVTNISKFPEQLAKIVL